MTKVFLVAVDFQDQWYNSLSLVGWLVGWLFVFFFLLLLLLLLLLCMYVYLYLVEPVYSGVAVDQGCLSYALPSASSCNDPVFLWIPCE